MLSDTNTGVICRKSLAPSADNQGVGGSVGRCHARRRQSPALLLRRYAAFSGVQPSLFIAADIVCLDFQYPAHGSLLWNERYSLAVAMLHWDPLFSSRSCSQLTGIDTPMPGRTRAEKAAAVV